MRTTLGPAAREPAAEQPAEFSDDLGGEARIVDVLGHADKAAGGSLPNRGIQRPEQFFVGVEVRKRPTRRI